MKEKNNNLIKFPKTKEFELRNAIQVLEYISEIGYDFSIQIPKEAACELFEDEGDFKDIVTMVSSEEFGNDVWLKRKSIHLISNE